MNALRHVLQTHPNVIVYRPDCPYSQRAVQWTRQGTVLPFVLMNTLDYPGLHDALKATTGQTTVPYVIVGRRLIGGWDALATMKIDTNV